MTPELAAPEAALTALEAVKALRGAGLQLSDEIKREIARRVNEEKIPGRVVARELHVAPTTVYRVAGIARGDAKFVQPEPPPKQPRMAVPMPQCPFEGQGSVSLRGRRLSADEKYYLACLVNVERMQATQVAAKYDLLLRTVERYAAVARSGKPFRAPGAPRATIVDEESDRVLTALAAVVGDQRLSREDFLTHLKREAVKTQEREQVKKAMPPIGVAHGPNVVADGDGIEVTDGERRVISKPRRGDLFCPDTYSKYLRLYGY